jgi:DNA replication protein DnaD
MANAAINTKAGDQVNPEGYIKIHRKMLRWEWISDPNTLCLFIHLLLNAAYEAHGWKGMKLLPGQLITGRLQLSKQTGLSIQAVRTSLDRLKLTSSITIESTNKGSLITLVNWDTYQSNRKKSNQQDNQQTNHAVTSKQPASNQQVTTTKESKEREERKEGKETVMREDDGGGGFLSASDLSAYRESMAAIEDKAKSIGMPPWAASDITKAESLMADYSAKWLLEAMKRAGNGTANARSWRYIEGILKAWKAKGGMDSVNAGSDPGRAKQGPGSAQKASADLPGIKRI